MGPMPIDNFCFNMKIHCCGSHIDGIDVIKLGLDDASDGTLHFKDISLDEAKNGIIVCAQTCNAKYVYNRYIFHRKIPLKS